MDREPLTKELLENLYLSKKMTMREISEVTNNSIAYICKKMKQFGIQSRPRVNEYSIAKMSLTKKGKPSPLKGTHLSCETKEKISNANKGKIKKKTTYGGHSKQRRDGYIAIYVPDHPYSSKEGYVMEHILVMENAIKRYITKDEVVHHINHIRSDNRLENLQLMSYSEHAKLHLIERRNNGLLKHHTVKVRNKTTGEVFNSVKEAGQKYSVSPNNISYACSGKIKTVKKCEWEYIKENKI